MHKVFYWNNARFSQCIPYPMYFFTYQIKKALPTFTGRQRKLQYKNTNTTKRDILIYYD